MQKMFISFLMLLSVNMFAANFDLSAIRIGFYEAIEDSDKAKIMEDKLNELAKTNNPIILGYKATLAIVMAKHTYNPYNKFKYFVDGKQELEKIIAKNPDILELRFMRLSIQSNAPSFLGYTDKISTDKEYLLNALPSLGNSADDKQLRKYIVDFLLSAKYCTSQDKVLLNKYKN